MKLKNKTNMSVSESCQFLIPQLTYFGSVYIYSPPVGFIKVPAICRKVVFPAPLAPTIVTISPCWIEALIPFKTWSEPKDLLIWLASMIAIICR